MLDDGTINGKIAKAAFDEVMACGKPPRAIVAERALVQVTDADVIGAAIDRVLGAHSDEVAKYRGGKDEPFDCFVGR